MPVSYLTADAVRAEERATGELLTNGTLMRRASHGVAQAVAALLAERTNGVVGRAVGIVVGAGDNGGDALYAGAELARRGAAVRSARRCSPPTRHMPVGWRHFDVHVVGSSKRSRVRSTSSSTVSWG